MDLISMAFSAYNGLIQLISTIVYIWLFVISAGIAWAAHGLNLLVHLKIDTNLEVVVTLWTVVRDFTNMFFVLILVIMALGMIFDVGVIPGLGGVDTRKLIGKFIITALLINFSLTIGGMIIDGFAIINSTFLASIGDFSERLGQALNPSATLLGISPEEINAISNINVSKATSGASLSHIVKMIGSIVMASIILFSLIVALFFALVRVPILMALLVFSPVAWIASILPSTQSISKEWWNKFIGWNLFLPVFLFFLYFGLYMISVQDDILGSITEGFAPQTVKESFATGLDISFQTIFYYFIVAFTLIMGTKFAHDAASGGGKLLTDTVSRGKNFAMGLPGFNQYRAARSVVGKEFEEVQKEGIGRLKIGGKGLGDREWFKRLDRAGLNPYGGKKGMERQEEEMAARLGFKGFEDDKLITKKVGDKKKDFREKDLSTEKLLSNLQDLKDRTDPEGKAEYYASAELLLEKKRLGFDRASEILQRYKKDSKASAGAFQDRLTDQIIDKAKNEGFQGENEFKVAYGMLAEDSREKFLDTVKNRNMVFAIEQRVETLKEEYKKEIQKRREKGNQGNDDQILDEILKESADITKSDRFRTQVKEIFSKNGDIIDPNKTLATMELMEGLASGFSNKDIQNLMNDPLMNPAAMSGLKQSIAGLQGKQNPTDQDKKQLDLLRKRLTILPEARKALGLQLNQKRIIEINKNASAGQRKNLDGLVKDVVDRIKKDPMYKKDFDNLKTNREKIEQAAEEFAEAVGDKKTNTAKSSAGGGRKGGPAGFAPSGSKVKNTP